MVSRNFRRFPDCPRSVTIKHGRSTNNDACYYRRCSVGFAVTILRNNRMRSLSVATIFVVGYVLSAVAQNSTPKPGKPPTQVAPNLEPPWPVKPAWPERPATQVAPNPESSLSEELDKAAMRVLKELENPTQAIPDPSAPIRQKTR